LDPTPTALQEALECLSDNGRQRFNYVKQLQERINDIFIEAFQAQGFVSREVSDSEITLFSLNDAEHIKALMIFT
jgi:hypothetical protein